jgi:hypothetical protein
MDPFFQQSQYRWHSLFPQGMWSTLVLSGRNTVVTLGKPHVHIQSHVMTRDGPDVDSQGYVITQDKPDVDSQGYVITQDKPDVDSEGYVITQDKPDVDSQGNVMTRDQPIICSQGQDLEDDSVNEAQLKSELYPCRGSKQVTHRTDDSITFIEDGDVQQTEPDIKLIPEGVNVPLVNSSNEVSVDSIRRPAAIVADPSRCVWAIICCCSPGSNEVRNPCFELLGCPGPFWDSNPCNGKMTGAAIKVARGYYYSGKQQ